MKYIANINFLGKDGMVKAGDEVENPSKGQIDKGLVRELKVDEPKETKQSEKPKDEPKKDESFFDKVKKAL